MRRIIQASLIVWAAAFVIPLIALKDTASLSVNAESNADVPSVENIEEYTRDEGESEALRHDGSVLILSSVDGVIGSYYLDEYLVGVLAAEMPALYPEEALKAQAVAARTYIIYKKTAFDINPNIYSEHPGAMVCNNPGHCKAYLTKEQMRQKWGDDYSIYYERIRAAVAATDGRIMVYNGKPIVAVFHAVSSGMTENASDIWGGTELPYLTCVESEGDKLSPRYAASVSVSADEFKAAFLSKKPTAALGGAPSGWFSTPERSEAGTVLSIKVGGVTLSGSELRSMFSLQSSNFTISVRDNTIRFDTIGYGHGVGMSQYGAKSFAEEGKTYEEILLWYYKGVEIVSG